MYRKAISNSKEIARCIEDKGLLIDFAYVACLADNSIDAFVEFRNQGAMHGK